MLLNWTACKKLVLDTAERTRAHKFTRVSTDVRDYLEGALRKEVAKIVSSHPGIGKTIMMGTHKREDDNVTMC